VTFSHTALAVPLIAITYLRVAVGAYPRLCMNRGTIALVGAVALIALGVLPLDVALASLDANTLLLLFAMMIVNVHLRLAGFFQWVAAFIVARAQSPRRLLAWIILAAGILAALFLNDTIVLMFTPLVLEMTTTLKRNPLPYLVGLATAANIGSTATITGNPQNMLIGMTSQISFIAFLAALVPVALAGLAIAWFVLVTIYRDEFATARFETLTPTPRIYTPLLRKTLALTALMLVAFFAGAPIPLAALTVAAALLVTRRIKPERIFAEVDWSLLIFFQRLVRRHGRVELPAFFGRDVRLGRTACARRGRAAGTNHSRVEQPHFECSRRNALSTARPAIFRPHARVADAGDGFDAGGQPDAAWLSREPHRRRIGAGARGEIVVRRVFTGRCADYAADRRPRNCLAERAVTRLDITLVKIRYKELVDS
jgi:di/tricarboxylate transporter